MSDHTLGIDFGTSTTLIAVREGRGEPRVVPIGRTTPWLPSVVGLGPNGELVVGEDALALDPRLQIRSIKARITNGETDVEVGGVRLAARDVLRALLLEAMRRAELARPKIFETTNIFLGCPALWTGTQRRLLTDSVHELGLDVDVADVIDEPVAAGLHTVHSRLLRGGLPLSGRTVVFDAGGGTLDVAFLGVTGDDTADFTVLSAEGIPASGDAVDDAVVKFLQPQIADLADPEFAMLLLRERARELKEGLSRDETRTTALGARYDKAVSPSRPELEDVFEPQLQRSFNLTKSTVRGAELRVMQVPSTDEIRRRAWDLFAAPVEHVVLVGGLSQMPVIAREIQHVFPNASVTLADAPQESVVLGLAMGDQLNRLNLPRPPVNFTVSFGSEAVLREHGLTDWAHENRLVYEAFTPLYRWDQLIRGESHLAYRFDIPFPPGFKGELDCTIRCEAPSRKHEPLMLRVNEVDANGKAKQVEAGGINVGHSSQRPIRFNLYTNGDLLITGSSGKPVRLRVKRWPMLRGHAHDQRREIDLDYVSSGPYGSKLRFDDWRFN